MFMLRTGKPLKRKLPGNCDREVIHHDWLKISKGHSLLYFHKALTGCSGGSRISGKRVYIYKGVGVRFADFLSFFLNIPWKWNNLVSLRPNYFIYIEYWKTEDGEGDWSEPPEPPLDPQLWLVKGYKLCHLRWSRGQPNKNWAVTTMWHVWPAKAQISLRICAVWPEPLLVAWIFYEC